MNSTVTTIYHLAPEKAVLSLVGLVVSPIISGIMYWLAVKRLKEGETSKSKAHLFYRMISGILLAQFIGHTYWYVYPYWFIAIFVALGYVTLDVGEGIGRIWNRNPHYTGPPDHSNVFEDIGLDKKTNTTHSIIVADDLTSPEFSDNVFLIQDNVKDMTKRQWMLGVLLFCLSIICCVDGFHLAITAISAPLIVSYYVHGICLSIVVYSAMIHAHYHTEESHRWLWWIAITCVWSLVYFSSAIFVLIEQPQQYIIVEIIHHPAFIAIYGFASGILLKMQHYFHSMKMETYDKRELGWGMIVFALSVSVAMATSVYL